MDFQRIPVTVIEIDQDRCALTFSEGACPATGEPCYNTLATCKATEAYTLGDPLTLRFSMADRAEGFDEYVIPNIKSVTTDPTRINVGGRRGRESPLGLRSQAKVQAIDHPHSDQLVDPYVSQRSYDPLERSTFWAKWLRRNPYYVNRPMRIKEGFAGQSLNEMQTRNYIIERIEGPDSSGRVSIAAKDILRLADNDKAKAPALSSGKLLVEYPEESTASFIVTGGTLAQYTAYGTKAVHMGDEVIRYTSVTELSNGDLEFSGITRATDGSEQQSHDAEDSVQACLEYVNANPWDVVYDLLTEFGSVPTRFCNLSAWTAEGERWLANYPLTRLLTEPEGVTTLLGELSEQCLFYLWWDERSQQVRFKAIAPSIGGVPLLTERDNLLADSVSIKIKPDERASEVWVNFLPRDATSDDKKRKEFRRTRARVDLEAASDFQYQERIVYEVFSRWLTTDVQSSLLALRLLNTFRDPPKYLSFSLDVAQRDIGPGDSFDVQYRGFVDDSGLSTPVRYEVISSHEPDNMGRVKIEAIQSLYGANRRYGLIAPNDTPVYGNADDDTRASYVFISQNDGTMTNGDDGYQII